MAKKTRRKKNVVALAGGVGGAKLAVGLQEVLAPDSLTVIVNTADDFEHWGLKICPDLDTVMYNLAGVNNPATGWGRVNETFTVLETVDKMGGEDWFRLGDQDLATHIRRTEWLRQNISLTEVTERLRLSLGIPSAVYPMSDDIVYTLMHTKEGDLPFQHYFVRRQCEPVVVDMTFVGAEEATITDYVKEALEQADLIVICPSNPYLSIDPILSIPELREKIQSLPVPKVAVSPIVGGEAIKGPAAKLMRELGKLVSPLTVFDHFADLLDGFIVDIADSVMTDLVKIPVLVTDTIMTDKKSKARLAQDVVDFSRSLTPNIYLQHYQSNQSTSNIDAIPAIALNQHERQPQI